jgi:hypothetical protein
LAKTRDGALHEKVSDAHASVAANWRVVKVACVWVNRKSRMVNCAPHKFMDREIIGATATLVNS